MLTAPAKAQPTHRLHKSSKKNLAIPIFITFTLDGKKLVVVSETTIRVWDVETGICEKRIPIKKQATQIDDQSLFAISSTRLIVTPEKCLPVIYDIVTDAPPTLFQITYSAAPTIQCMTISIDGNTLITSHDYITPVICVWDVASGALLRTLKTLSKSRFSQNSFPKSSCLVLNSDNTLLAYSYAFQSNQLNQPQNDAKNTIIIWDIATGRALNTIYENMDARTFRFSLDNNLAILSCSAVTGRTINFYNLFTSRLWQTPSAADQYWSYAFSPDTKLVIGWYAFKADVFLTGSGILLARETKQLEDAQNKRNIESLAWHPDSKAVALALKDGSFKIVKLGDEGCTTSWEFSYQDPEISALEISYLPPAMKRY